MCVYVWLARSPGICMHKFIGNGISVLEWNRKGEEGRRVIMFIFQVTWARGEGIDVDLMSLKTSAMQFQSSSEEAWHEIEKDLPTCLEYHVFLFNLGTTDIWWDSKKPFFV